MFPRHWKRFAERGQSLVILAGGIIAMLAMVGLVIDGGNAFAQQRATQNGMDAASEAGAVELARRMLGIDPVGDDVTWDARVDAAVKATAANNGLTLPSDPLDPNRPEYTDYLGAPLGAKVGDGVIPPTAQGVQAGGSRTFSTYFVGVMGFGNFTASAEATAVTGWAEESGHGALIPLALPITLTQCDSGGGPNKLAFPLGGDPDAVPPTGQWPIGPENPVAIPICANGPGNVGWIDWYQSGGASTVADSIRNPNSPPIDTPKWYLVTETGAMTSLDDDMDIWEGKDITLPIFYSRADDPGTAQDESLLGTCDSTPGGDQDLLSDCPPGDEWSTGTSGWYFLVTLGDFHLLHSYIQGNHETECNDPALASVASTGLDANNCLIGYFRGPVVRSNLSVGPSTTAPTAFTPFAVQLIK
jgi:hypothetical protein